MEKAKLIERLIRESGMNIKTFAKKCGIPSTTLYSILKRGVGKASVDTIITICNNLHITIEELDCMSKGIEYKGKSFEELQALIEKERKALTIEEKNNLIKTLLADEPRNKAKDA